MDFFDHQVQAKRRTALLIMYFLCALVAVAAAVNLSAWLLTRWLHPNLSFRDWLSSEAGLWITGATLAVLIGGSLRKAWQLRGGGPALADLLGARELPANPENAAERRLVNVVEEISIAAGGIPPRTYVLPREDRINAFVAGLTPATTVLVLTQGALERLDRDELQGVVAHEFSHILNADMRLNLRLLAALAGVLAIGKVGEFLLHVSTDGSRRGLPLFASIGLGLMVIGYAGLFFGRLIKAAISRQRERLADASAVQFTRQPGGLAGALIKIRDGGSHLRSLHAEDLSHMAFAETLGLRWRRLLATHPSLDERLRALGSDWPVRARVRARRRHHDGGSGAGPSRQVGSLDQANLGYARSLLESIPESLHQALHTQEGAECVLYALALGQLPVPAALRTGRRGELVDQVRALGTRLRLPLLDLAIATLRQAPDQRRPVILAQLQAITRHRGRDDLLCWSLAAIAHRTLTPPARLPRPEIRRLSAVAAEIQVVFSALAWAGDSARSTALAAFQRATHGLLPAGRLLLPPDRCPPARLQAATDRLARLTPLLKAPLIDAAADLVLADGRVQVAEAELLRALCTLLDCPMPPLFQSRDSR